MTSDTSKPTHKMSLLICSRNRSQRLPRLLESVAAIDYPAHAWELVFVNNASTDDTEAVFKREAGRLGLSARYVFESEPGLARARNTGVLASSGDIIAFTDDDCFAHSDLLTAYADVFRDERLGFAGGAVKPYGVSQSRLTTQETTHEVAFEPWTIVRPGNIHGANMACRKAAYESVGGFDVLLGAGGPLKSAEDTDFLARVLLAGWHGLYSPKPIIFHDHGRETPEEIRRITDAYAIGRGAYYAKLGLRKGGKEFRKVWFARMRAQLTRLRIRRVAHELLGALKYIWLNRRTRNA